MIQLAASRHETELFRVLAHASGRRALWPTDRALPLGWHEVLSGRPKEHCLEYLRQEWTGLNGRVKQARRSRIDFGLMFFGSGEHDAAGDKYRCVIDCAKYADAHGLSAVWLPERHFSAMGCLHPNPAVLHAALARETSRIRLRAGSVVLPLHHPMRVAEDWAVVDNLSNGRVDLAFASGWNPEDFALRPEAYRARHAEMFAAVETVRRLWRGETVATTSGDGSSIAVRVYPTPIQPELPLWITAAESAATFEQAGAIGANLLTHLFDLSVDELAGRIALYRDARRRAGFDPEEGRVAVALHTFIADDIETVRLHSKAPYCRYLKSNVRLIEKFAASRGLSFDVASLSEAQLDEAVDFLFEKFLHGRSLLGTPDSCTELVGQLVEKGVNEIACLLDFGPTAEAILGGLPSLRALMERFR